MPASELRANPKNWRRHPPAQREALSATLAQIGFADVALARETADGLELVDGHLRADLAGDAEIPVAILDLDEREADLLLATLDPLAAMAETDGEAWASLLRDAQGADDDLDKLIGQLGKQTGAAWIEKGQADPDAVPDVPKKPKAKRGDLYLLGDHRLLCGDATDAGDVARLMGGEKAGLMVADPPYGVELDQGWRDRRGLNRLGHAQADRLEGDAQADWAQCWRLSPADVAYVWSAPAALQLVAGAALQESGFELRQQIIWSKTMAPLSRSAYHWKHEPCWYAVRKGAKANWGGDRTQTTIWEAASPKHIMGGSDEEKLDHPTQKPVELMERPMRNHDFAEVYDPFVGSGTTIIAAERQGRLCYAMEIEPAYVDVCVRRWEEYTGGKAKRAR